MSAAAAKNLILSGVKSVTLHDTGHVEMRDLGAQFYLQESDVGSNRAEACLKKLQELNAAVSVTASTQELTSASLAPFQVIIECKFLVSNDFCAAF